MIRSPWARYSGTCTTRPVLKVAGLLREEADAAFMAGAHLVVTLPRRGEDDHA